MSGAQHIHRVTNIASSCLFHLFTPFLPCPPPQLPLRLATVLHFSFPSSSQFSPSHCWRCHCSHFPNHGYRGCDRYRICVSGRHAHTHTHTHTHAHAHAHTHTHTHTACTYTHIHRHILLVNTYSDLLSPPPPPPPLHFSVVRRRKSKYDVDYLGANGRVRYITFTCLTTALFSTSHTLPSYFDVSHVLAFCDLTLHSSPSLDYLREVLCQCSCLQTMKRKHPLPEKMCSPRKVLNLTHVNSVLLQCSR